MRSIIQLVIFPKKEFIRKFLIFSSCGVTVLCSGRLSWWSSVTSDPTTLCTCWGWDDDSLFLQQEPVNWVTTRLTVSTNTCQPPEDHVLLRALKPFTCAYNRYHFMFISTRYFEVLSHLISISACWDLYWYLCPLVSPRHAIWLGLSIGKLGMQYRSDTKSCCSQE